MLAPALVVPTPSIELRRVHDAVRRFPRSAAAWRDVPLIAPDDGEAAAGPDGFEVHARRIEPGERVEHSANAGWVRSLHVLSGELACPDGTRLGRFDSRLLSDGRPITVSSHGTEGATYLQLDFRRRNERRSSRLFRPRSVARVRDMQPLRRRFPLRWVPRPIYDLLSPRDLYPVLGPVAAGPGRFEIVGPDELVVVIARTPKGTGPALHVHTLTTEMFVVLEGKFRVTWGDAGEHSTELNPLDAIVVPQGVSRAFEALTDGPNWIMPIVVGTNDESRDIVWLEDVAQRLQELAPPLFGKLLGATRFRVGQRATP